MLVPLPQAPSIAMRLGQRLHSESAQQPMLPSSPKSSEFFEDLDGETELRDVVAEEGLTSNE